MKLTILFALVTAALSQAGFYPMAEVAYVAASAAALFQGSRAITDAVRMVRCDGSDSSVAVPAL